MMNNNYNNLPSRRYNLLCNNYKHNRRKSPSYYFHLAIMSTNLNYKQVANVSRRTWDVEAYEKRAQDRANNGGNYNKATEDGTNSESAAREEDDKREEFVPAASGSMGPQSSKRAFLKARTNKIKSLDAKIGSVEIVNPEAAATTKSVASDGALVDRESAVTKSGIGWHCKVCDCFLKDSLTYLDHINGRKHQRNLGYSMRVERSTKDQVVSRLVGLVKAKEKSIIDQFAEDEEQEDFNVIVKAKDEELKRRKEERKRERKERKKKKKEQQKAGAETEITKPEQIANEREQNTEDGGNTESNDDGMDPNMAAMMGFSGFGGGNKNR